MKKRKYRVKLSNFKNKKDSQVYYMKQKSCNYEYYLEIYSIQQLDENYWLVFLEDGSKYLLNMNDFIFYVKKEKSE